MAMYHEDDHARIISMMFTKFIKPELHKMFSLDAKHYDSTSLVWYHRSLNLVPKSAYSSISCPNSYMYIATRMYFKYVHTLGGTRLGGTSYYQMILLAVRTCVLETINPDTEHVNLDEISLAKFTELANDMKITNEEVYSAISLRLSLSIKEIGVSKQFQRDADKRMRAYLKQGIIPCVNYIVPSLDSQAVPYNENLYKEKITMDLQYTNNTVETLRNYLYNKIWTGEQVDPLIVVSYMYLLAEQNFGTFIKYVNWGTVTVCKAGDQAGVGDFIKIKEANHTLENSIDCPDSTKYTYGILLYYISHLRIKKDTNADTANYKSRTIEKVKEILRISNVILPREKVDTLNVGDTSLSIIASNQENPVDFQAKNGLCALENLKKI
ncbi:hypothetical protein A3Q56_01664 [Intoshia linei]|uniref:Uncharacterized protein n=1 Tax=Intoshia linei TaxID=1819745 RepID=A0A177B8J2_9BILA|nr:hypothetical protein A3Q56_01664 [Intoshia linei]